MTSALRVGGWSLPTSRDRVDGMSSEAPRFERHVFICVNARQPGGKPSCGGRGGAAVHAAFVDAIARDPALCGRVAVTDTGCLGPCFEGPNAVVYPDGVWYAHLGVDAVARIAGEHLRDGRVVAELVRGWGDDDDD